MSKKGQSVSATKEGPSQFRTQGVPNQRLAITEDKYSYFDTNSAKIGLILGEGKKSGSMNKTLFNPL